MKKIFTINLFLFSFAVFSCNTIDPPNNKIIKLTVEDVSCTETWLKLETENIDLPAQINLLVDDKLKSNYTVSTHDTLLYVDSLLPNRTYTVKAQAPGIQNLTSSIELTTLDTTSHNFTFETFTFGGDAGSSALYDVAIIDENNIWAVGGINIADTSENGYTTYNAVHWDGNKWELRRIMFYTVCGQQSRTSYPAKSIFAFNENEIWIALDGSQIAKIENGVQTQTICLPWSFSINKIWGASSNDLYIVGNGGNIAHYQNGSWQKIESGTTTKINDAWGIINPLTGKEVVYCAVTNKYEHGDQKILKITDNLKVGSINWGIKKKVQSVWTKEGSIIYTAGDGLHEYKHGNWKKIDEIPSFYSNSIRGENLNEIFVCGDYGLLSHFNGIAWKTYNELRINGIYHSLAIKNEIVVVVGEINRSAIVIIGNR